MDAVFARRAEAPAAAVSAGAKCPDPSAGDSEGGTPLWLQSYDALEISGLAAGHEGQLLIARSGAETRALGCAGETLWSVPYGARVAVDDEGSVYVAGARSGAGAFVTKLDGAGAVLYDTDLGAEASGDITSLAVDAARNVAISGPGLGTVKLDATGARAWQRPYAGQIAFDSAGSLWLVGSLEGRLELGATTLVSRGGADILLLKLGADGAPLVARSFGDAALQQHGEAIAVDANDNLVITGTFDGNVDFGAGSLVWRSDACSTEAWCETAGFVAKFDAGGSAVFSKSIGAMRALSGVAFDSHGNAAVSGAFPGNVRPYRQPRLLFLDADGQQLWQRSEWPDTGLGAGHAVVADADDNVVWAISARPSLQLEEQAYLAKLAH